MRVIKIGGGCLNGNRTIADIMDLLTTHGEGNVEMISFGPSPAALYLLCREADLAAAVTAIHSTCFGTPRCLVPTARSKTS